MLYEKWQPVNDTLSSNYGLYIQERLGMQIIENNKGFVTYEFEPMVLWLRDFFVKKEFRQQGVAKEWMLELCNKARLHECTEIRTHVCVKSNGWELSLKLMVDFGYVVVGQVDSLIYLTYKV